MESRATTIAKNLAIGMVFTAGALGGAWVLAHSFLAVYYMWIVFVAFQVLLYVMALAVFLLVFILAVGAIYSAITAVTAIFRRKKNDDE